MKLCVWTTCSFSLDGCALTRGEVCRAGLVKYVGAAEKYGQWYRGPESSPGVLGVVLGVMVGISPGEKGLQAILTWRYPALLCLELRASERLG